MTANTYGRKKRNVEKKVTPPICPYCGYESTLVHSSAIYSNGSDYGMMWACTPCDA